MTPDRLRREDAERWLLIARTDLHDAGVLAGAQSYATSLFHCQQAAEKALKGLLTFAGKPFRKTHDISELSTDCLAIDSSLESVVARAERLTQYAWRFRYPGAPFEPGAEETAEALDAARAVLERVEEIVRSSPATES
jgi:HEPN domain-containing protein